jgi:glycosyltransferase involved in cell wall biosynthesis
VPIGASVIVPVFNGEATLRACLAATLDQDVSDFEVLVVDDASTDGTAAIAESVARADSRVRVLRLSENGGPARARNLAIRASRAPLLLFADSDCIVDRSWVRLHGSAQHPPRIVGGAVVGVHATPFGRADAYCSWFGSIPSGPPQARRKDHLPTANLSVARSVFERAGLFREGEPLYSEDAEFCERARRAGIELFFDPSIIVRHRDRDRLGDYLRHQWIAGIQMLNYRREPGARYRWLVPRNRCSGVLLAVPLAAAFTAFVVKQWLTFDPRVVPYAPLIFAGKLAQTLAMATHSHRPSRVDPIAPPLRYEPASSARQALPSSA